MTFDLTGSLITLKTPDTSPLTSGSSNVFTVTFNFDSSWAGFTCYAAFLVNGQRHSVILTNDSAIIPDDVLAEEGSVQIGAFGLKEGYVYPSLWSEPFEIWPGAYEEGTQ